MASSSSPERTRNILRKSGLVMEAASVLLAIGGIVQVARGVTLHTPNPTNMCGSSNACLGLPSYSLEIDTSTAQVLSGAALLMGAAAIGFSGEMLTSNNSKQQIAVDGQIAELYNDIDNMTVSNNAIFLYDRVLDSPPPQEPTI